MKKDPFFSFPLHPLQRQEVLGKQVAVVGGTGGLGRALALELASHGAHVTVVGQTFRDGGVANIAFIQADLSLMSEARRVASLLPAESLDLVVFTTGIFAAPERQVTAEGIERDMAVSYLSRLVILRHIAPRLGKRLPMRHSGARVFIMGYPGTGQAGELGDLNAERGYRSMAVHMNTVAGNEMLVLDGARQYTHVKVFGLNPGLVKTDIRRNFLGHSKLLFTLLESAIGLLTPSATTYAQRIAPLLFAPELNSRSGALFNNKGQAILPSPQLTTSHIAAFLAQSHDLLAHASQNNPAALQVASLTSMRSPMNQIFSPIRLGRYTLRNRVAMAPMTRSRAQYDGTPKASAATYYAQRASVGVIVTEGTQPSDDGQGYMMTPGIYTDAHVAGWRVVSDAVHAHGGLLFIQLMHAGRLSHPDNTPHHRQGVAPSAIGSDAQMFTPTGPQVAPVPRALSLDEIQQTIADFRLAARRAIEAGADGVEIHGANAYLIQQFLAPSSNTRTDAYGGSIENRARFAIEVAKAIVDEIGADRTSIRLSPGTTLWGIDEGAEGPDLYRYLVAELDKLGLAYLHVMHQGNEPLLADIRQLWHGTLMLNRPGKTREQIGSDLTAGLADVESYGQMVLANPDFIERLQAGASMTAADRNSFFGGTDAGYIDYPTLAEQQATA